MASPITFGNNHFKTQGEAIEKIKKRISLYKVGEKLNQEDELFFTELFKLHSEYEEKVSSDISFIAVDESFGKKNLKIHCINGDISKISWRHCLKPISPKSVILGAFRRAVDDIVYNFKTTSLEKAPHCPKLHIPLDISNSRVTYIKPTFEELVLDFLDKKNLDILSINLIDPNAKDKDQRGIIKDENLSKDWLEYHLNNANLELWSTEANQKRNSAR